MQPDQAPGKNSPKNTDDESDFYDSFIPRFRDSLDEQRTELLQRFQEHLLPYAFGGGWQASPLSEDEQRAAFKNVLVQVFAMQDLRFMRSKSRRAFFEGEAWTDRHGVTFRMPALAHRRDGESGKLEFIALIESQNREKVWHYIGFDDLLTCLPGPGYSVLWSLSSHRSRIGQMAIESPFDFWGLMHNRRYRSAPQLTSLSFHNCFLEPFLSWDCGLVIPHLEVGPPPREGDSLSSMVRGAAIHAERIVRKEVLPERVTIEVPLKEIRVEVTFNHTRSGMLTCDWKEVICADQK